MTIQESTETFNCFSPDSKAGVKLATTVATVCPYNKGYEAAFYTLLYIMNGEGLEIFSERARDCTSVEAKWWIYSGCGFVFPIIKTFREKNPKGTWTGLPFGSYGHYQHQRIIRTFKPANHRHLHPRKQETYQQNHQPPRQTKTQQTMKPAHNISKSVGLTQLGEGEVAYINMLPAILENITTTI